MTCRSAPSRPLACAVDNRKRSFAYLMQQRSSKIWQFRHSPYGRDCRGGCRHTAALEVVSHRSRWAAQRETALTQRGDKGPCRHRCGSVRVAFSGAATSSGLLEPQSSRNATCLAGGQAVFRRVPSHWLMAATVGVASWRTASLSYLVAFVVPGEHGAVLFELADAAFHILTQSVGVGVVNPHGPWHSCDHVEIATLEIRRLVQPPPPAQRRCGPATRRLRNPAPTRRTPPHPETTSQPVGRYRTGAVHFW